MTEDPTNVVELARRNVELKRRAGAQGFEAVDYLEAPGGRAELLILKPTERSILDDDEGRLERLGTVPRDIVKAAIAELGRHRRRRIEELGRPALDVAVDVLPHLIAEEVLAINSGSKDREGKLRDLVEALIRLEARTLDDRAGIAGGTGRPLVEVDEVLGVVYRVVSTLPGLESAHDHAEAVTARLGEELKP